MVLRAGFRFPNSGRTRAAEPVRSRPRLVERGPVPDFPAVFTNLPRRSDGSGSNNASERAFSLGNFFREHRRAVFAVVAGATVLPMAATVAHATQPTTALPTTVTPTVSLATATTAVAETFDAAALTNYPLFKLFWNSTNLTDGTSHEGLDEVTPDGVRALVDFAKKHNLDGTVSPDANKAISDAERSLIKAILENPNYGTFFELDALPPLFQEFGIERSTVHTVAEAAAEARTALAHVLGISADALHLSFPKAGPTAETTYLSMDGGMATSMSYVDQYREALGLPKLAESYEKAPVLGWMMGVESGHTKYGSFSEKSPFSTSGLNWGVLLFPGDTQIANLPVKSGFEFPIDALTGFDRSVGANVRYGDHITVVDKTGAELVATKVIHKDASGKAESWSAVFKTRGGQEVKAEDVIGLIKDASGRTKGDGDVSGSMSMGWWGFCDRNTAGRLYKSKFGIPNIDRDVKIEVNGKFITIPKAEAQKLLDVDVTDMAGRPGFVGARFDDEPMTIVLADGRSIEGKVDGIYLRMGPNSSRNGGDEVTMRNTASDPFVGGVQIENSYGGKSFVSLEDVESITKKADGTVEIKTRGVDYTHSGKLLTNLSFAGAETGSDGSMVLKNTKENPIMGEYVINLGAGKTQTVKASDVKSISGEMQQEMEVLDYVRFIARHGGTYATDNSTGVVVSNGMRWVNRLDVKLHTGAENPDWAKGKLQGVEGKLTRESGDQLLFIDGLYKSDYSNAYNSAFQGWVQLSSTGKVLNQGFISGEPDFGWAAEGPLNWNASSSFNPHMTPEMRVKILVNGITDVTKLESLASSLNLPSNWKELRLPN